MIIPVGLTSLETSTTDFQLNPVIERVFPHSFLVKGLNMWVKDWKINKLLKINKHSQA